MKTVGVIPARLGSTRLHQKVLRLIGGKPMIQWVWERARRAGKLSDLIVACDDSKVRECVESFHGRAVMTRIDHLNGSSRVAEIAKREEADVFINIQGDEPLIHPSAIDELVTYFEKDPKIKAATLAVRKTNGEDYQNPNVVKVVTDGQGCALYFSRSPIPYFREKPAGGISFLKHLGIYGYQKSFLLEFVTWNPGVLEEKEKLEQLRILEQGIPIHVVETSHDSWSVDTAEDLEVVESKLKARSAASPSRDRG